MKIEIPEDFNLNVAKFSKYLEKFNQIHSLTNYKILNKTVKDSINAINFIPKYPKIAIDIGSGAGFPAIFLAMILDKTKWHLFEPNAKKAAFLTYVKVNLELKNVIIHRQKVQEAYKFHADLITSRALMKTKDLIKICSGFYDKDTIMLLYKGSGYENEIQGLNAQVFNDGIRNYILIKEIKCLQS